MFRNCEFDAQDRNVYRAWLQATLAAYGAAVLCGIMAAAFLATSNTPSISEFLTTAVALASP